MLCGRSPELFVVGAKPFCFRDQWQAISLCSTIQLRWVFIVEFHVDPIPLTYIPQVHCTSHNHYPAKKKIKLLQFHYLIIKGDKDPSCQGCYRQLFAVHRKSRCCHSILDLSILYEYLSEGTTCPHSRWKTVVYRMVTTGTYTPWVSQSCQTLMGHCWQSIVGRCSWFSG